MTDPSRDGGSPTAPSVRLAVAAASKKKKDKLAPSPQVVARWVLQCVALQRKIFPKCESLDIAAEVKKPHCTLFVALAKKPTCETTEVLFSEKGSNKKFAAAQGKKGQRGGPGGDQEYCVGFVLIARTGPTAYVSKVCVSEAYRRQGIGTKLIDFTVNFLKRARCQSIRLHVRDTTITLLRHSDASMPSASCCTHRSQHSICL